MQIVILINVQGTIMRALIAYSLMAVSVGVYANKPLSIKVDKNQSSFTVNLPANPTTGYQWSVVRFNKKLLTLSGSVYQKPDTQLMGAGGRMIYTFTVNKERTAPKVTRLVFQYARPWEKQDTTGSMQKVVVHFVGAKEKPTKVK